MNKDNKISITEGCADFLMKEVENLRAANNVLQSEMRIVNGFFGLVERIGDTKRQGYGEDLFWQATREIRDAKEASKKDSSAL